MEPDAKKGLDARAGSATGTKSAITYVGSGTKGPHVIYLAEGKRITVGRDKSTKGPAWLVIEDTPVVKAQSPNAKAMAREALPSATCSVPNYHETPTAENE